MLDELTTSGDVVWWGQSALSGGDGVVGIAPADRAHLLRPPAPDSSEDLGPIERAVVDALAGGGAYFFRDISDRVSTSNGITGDADVIEALWTLVWSGLVTNDSWAALRSRAGGARAPRTPTRGRRGRLAMPSRTGPPAAAGRWSLLPTMTASGTERARATGDALLDRYGIVTRGSVMAEHIDGGFSAVYRVLSAFEDAGRCRRTYAVDGLGAAQFALPVAVDQLRVRTDQNAEVVVLAASDPANAYGAALPWPAVEGATHRPARKAGALIVLVDGLPALYVERGGKSLLTWKIGIESLGAAAVALARSGPRLGMGRAPITRVNGSELADHPEVAHALGEAGFLSTPRGVRLPRTTA
jgi:ATP-dependent Lhr-like helicase